MGVVESTARRRMNKPSKKSQPSSPVQESDGEETTQLLQEEAKEDVEIPEDHTEDQVPYR